MVEAMTAGIVATIIIIVVGYVLFSIQNFIKRIFGKKN